MQIIGQLQGLSLVTAAALATVILNAVMILLTVGVRTGRSLRQSWEERYARRTEPHLDDFLATGQIPPEVWRWRPWHRDLLAALIVARMAQVRGADRDRLAHLAGELGLTAAYLERLGSPRRWRRARAAENLGYFGGPGAVGGITTLLSDDDETVRAVAARALARIGTPEGADALARALDDPSELTSLRVAENLERLGVLATGPLIAALGSSNPRGQVLAARILGNLRASEAQTALLKAARSGQDEDLRAQATRALGKIGDPDDLPVILQSSRDSAWPVRAQAANALGLIGDLSTVPALMALAVNREWWVRANATSALARMGPVGERALLELLTSRDRYARDRAAATLESQGITRRMAGELAGVDEKGERARTTLRAIVAAGATSYLRQLAVAMPDGANRRMLEEMLRQPTPEGEQPRLRREELVGIGGR